MKVIKIIRAADGYQDANGKWHYIYNIVSNGVLVDQVKSKREATEIARRLREQASNWIAG